MKCIAHKQCPKCADNGRDTRGDNLGVYEDGSEHCFACGYHRNGSYYMRRMFQDNQGLQGLNDGAKSLLPNDFTREVPAKYLKWLMQYELPWSYWKDKIGSSPSEERLYFLVGEPLAFSQGRYLGDQVPNHGQGYKSKWYTRGDCHKHAEVLGSGGSAIVLVEDLISAHKVAQVNTCIPMFGTTVHKPAIYYLIQENKPVILWLDNDQSHNVKAKALSLASMINNPVNIIVTDKDPKSCSMEEINASIKAVS